MKIRISYFIFVLSIIFLAVQCGKSEKISDIIGITGAGTGAITGGGTLTTQSGAPTVSNIALPTGVEEKKWSALTFQAADPEGDPFHYRIIYTQIPAGGTVTHIPADAATPTGAAVTTPLVTHQINHSAAGTYTFDIEVEDDQGNVSRFSPNTIDVSPVQVSAQLSATLVAPTTKFVTGQSYTFSLNVSDQGNVGIEGISWWFGGGSASERGYASCPNALSCSEINWSSSGTDKWVQGYIIDKLRRPVSATLLNITVEDAVAPPPPPPAVSCATSDATQFRMGVNGDWRGGTSYWWLDLAGIDNFTGFYRKTFTGNEINTGPIANFNFRLKSTGNCVNVESSYLTVKEIHIHWACSDGSQKSQRIYNYLTDSTGLPDYKFPSTRVCGSDYGWQFSRPQ